MTTFGHCSKDNDDGTGSGFIHIPMEFCPMGDLYRAQATLIAGHIHDVDTLGLVAQTAEDTAQGLQAANKMGEAVVDVKSENMFFVERGGVAYAVIGTHYPI